jgi:hypothetical protein
MSFILKVFLKPSERKETFVTNNTVGNIFCCFGIGCITVCAAKALLLVPFLSSLASVDFKSHQYAPTVLQYKASGRHYLML